MNMGFKATKAAATNATTGRCGEINAPMRKTSAMVPMPHQQSRRANDHDRQPRSLQRPAILVARHPVFVAESAGPVFQRMRIQLPQFMGVFQADGRCQGGDRPIVEWRLAAMLPVKRVAPLQIHNGQLACRPRMLYIAEVPDFIASFKCGRREQIQNAENGIEAEQPLQADLAGCPASPASAKPPRPATGFAARSPGQPDEGGRQRDSNLPERRA